VPVSFGAPLGLLALLGVPVVLFIHLLRQHPRRVPVTTLFLLAALTPEDLRGRRVEWPRGSWLLLLQLLVVLALAWVLSQPRWAQGARRLPVAVVLDESASMSTFSPDVRAPLAEALAGLGGAGVTLELTALSSHPARPVLAQGEGLAAADAALAAWRPELGAHDPGAALEVARQRVGPEGVVLWVTDHPGPRPDALVLSVGRPTENVGITGLGFEGEGWTVTVRNHGAAPATRAWRLMAGEVQADAGTLDLAPGEIRALRGAFPPGAARARLALAPDAFTLDDTLDMVRPRPKVLQVALTSEAGGLAWLPRLIATAPHVVVVPDPEAADLVVVAGKDGVRPALVGPASPRPRPWLRFALDPQLEARQPTVGVVVEQDALTEDLPWSGLVFRRPPRLEALPAGARVLVWKDETPLVVLGPGEDLLVRLDPRGSNAARSVALLLMLLRYLEQVREGLPRQEVRNVELREPLMVAADPAAGDVEVRAGGEVTRYPQGALRTLLAPARPGPFEVRQGEAVLMEGAARFADVREADLTRAGPAAPERAALAALREAGEAEDPLRGAWLVVALGLMLGSFWVSAGRGG
jgi:hypothetical protein